MLLFCNGPYIDTAPQLPYRCARSCTPTTVAHMSTPTARGRYLRRVEGPRRGSTSDPRMRKIFAPTSSLRLPHSTNFVQ